MSKALLSLKAQRVAFNYFLSSARTAAISSAAPASIGRLEAKGAPLV